MSDIPRPERFLDRIRGHWQLPVLVLSLVLLVLGSWRLVPEPPPPSFEELYGKADVLRAAQLHEDASLYIDQLLTDPARTADERRRLHGLMADVLFEYEEQNAVHGGNNSERIIQHSALAVERPEDQPAEMHRRRALAFEWLHREEQALVEYQQALAKNIDDPWDVRRHVLEIQQSLGSLTQEEFHLEYDTFLVGDGVPEELVCWAADQKVTLFDRMKQYAEAEAFLAHWQHRFGATPYRDEFEYLQAKTWHFLGRDFDAEIQLRALRDRVLPGDSLYARTGWLLGRIMQKQDSPEYARSFYEDVMEQTTPGPYRVASRFGRAEVLGHLQRYAESIEEYEEVIRLTAEKPYGAVVDLLNVRDSAEAFYEQLLAADQLSESLAYLQVAASLVKPSDIDAQAIYAERLAKLTLSLGQRSVARSETGEEGQGSAAKAYFREAAEHFLQLAKLTSLDANRSSTATWQAADAYDSAAERLKAAEVLERFVAERPNSPRAPEALLRLGQTYQASGDCGTATERYQQNLINHPSTPFAARSIVPLAECFVLMGQPDKAEEQLLRIIDHAPGDELVLLGPTAVQYRDALFALGDLYISSEQFEKAITRYEESLERYPTDPRSDRVTFMLAEAKRKSAERIYSDLQDAANLPYREDLMNKYRGRLKQAADHYAQVVERYRGRPASALDKVDELYMKLSHFRRADMVYDLSRIDGTSDLTIYAKAVDIYDRAKQAYQDDPMAMSAYVQMIMCHLRMGNQSKARMILERAKWGLRSISDEKFVQFAPPDRRRDYWEQYLQWLESSPMFKQPTS